MKTICAKCFTKPATHQVWLKFDNPEPYPQAVLDMAKEAGVDLPERPEGVFVEYCDECD